ncbi:hypothetical protein ACH4E5_17510 [Streptomyces afghaniensis]|uniref:hypothetical protein n=1 Tax=Streptomyces afghaniensis TaxID=66865 RepID=UPI00379323DD
MEPTEATLPLFDEEPARPLADRLRPTQLEDVVACRAPDWVSARRLSPRGGREGAERGPSGSGGIAAIPPRVGGRREA